MIVTTFQIRQLDIFSFKGTINMIVFKSIILFSVHLIYSLSPFPSFSATHLIFWDQLLYLMVLFTSFVGLLAITLVL